MTYLRLMAAIAVCIAAVAIFNPAAKADPALNPSAPYQYPFQDPALPTEQRIDNILSLMTVAEKIQCLGGNTSVRRLGIPGTGMMEGLHGLSLGGPRLAPPAPPPGAPPPPQPAAAAPAAAAAANPFRFRFPPVTTTQFPQAYGLGETWDPDLLVRVATQEGIEARYMAQAPKYNRSNLIVMSPNSDLGRDPRWGRTEECYGEDPFFNGTMVTAYVHGLQGDNPRYWLTASLLKHFLANSDEDIRNTGSSDFDDRLFREYYSVPFRMGIVDGGSRAFMAAYNGVNGIPMAVNPILRNVAIDEWGQNGIICTDGGAFSQLVNAHHTYPDLTQAAAGVVKSGITKILDRFQDSVQAAVDQKLITEKDLDEAIRPDFRILIKLGLLDPPSMVPYTSIGTGPEPWSTDDAKALVRKATDESIVLLKNDGLLPLDKSKIHSIAVIGPRADKVYIDWYGGLPPYTVTPRTGIQYALGPGVKVLYVPDNAGNQAARIAQMCDVAVVCVGNHPDGGDHSIWKQVEAPSEGREAVDRQSITLEQEGLIQQVFAANHRTVVVLVSSFPYAINWSQRAVPAILHMTHSSQEEGDALADVLFGDYNPSGRLVQTWPSSMDDLPPMTDFNIRNGRTYMYAKAKPLYPFGYGLSYTTFRWTNLRTSAPEIESPDAVTVSVDVTNTGKRHGNDVVELYASYPKSAVDRPREQLIGFKRVGLDPGKTRTVQITIKASELAYWDVAKHAFVVENAPVELRAARSADDVVLTKTIAVHSTPQTQLISARGE